MNISVLNVRLNVEHGNIKIYNYTYLNKKKLKKQK